MLNNELTKRLGIKYPIIQAPMAGGITTPELVSASTNCGGLGMIGAGYLSPEKLREQIWAVKKLTNGSFGVNLFVPNEYAYSDKEVELGRELLRPFEESFKVDASVSNLPSYSVDEQTFYEQIKVVIEEKVAICSFTFGLPREEIIADLKQQDIVLIGTATTVEEAIRSEKAGMDMVVGQGAEAGGHRGNFLNQENQPLIGLISLVPQIVDAVSIPVIAAGGIMDGRGVLAALCLGAEAVQMGTAFLTTEESGAHAIHKKAIIRAKEEDAVLTRAFSGKWARGIKNRFIDEMEKYEDTIPVFPLQNTLTQKIRKASSAANSEDAMSLWSGQSPRLATLQSVEALFKKVISEVEVIAKQLR